MTTTAELKSAFKRSGLWRAGWSFDEAIRCDVIRRALHCTVRASSRKHAKQGNPAPMQPELI